MNISLNKEANRIRNLTMFKGCVHEDSKCNGITSKAHSIQNQKYLTRISNENGEVLCIDFGKIGLNKDLQLQLVGKGKASIFTGFCNHHDQIIFKPIEQNEYKLNDLEQNYLFAYRAFALAYYERHSSFSFMKEHFEIKKERGENTEEIEKKICYYKKHLNFIESLRNSMNNNLDNKRFGRITTEVLVWPRNYGVAATSMFFVDKDVQGNVINNPLYYISPFFFTIIPTEDSTVVLMSYLTKDKNRYKFLKDQIVNTQLDQQKKLVSNILAMNVENFFISPEQWSKTPIEIQKLYTDVFKNTSGREKPRIGYFNKLNIFIDID